MILLNSMGKNEKRLARRNPRHKCPLSSCISLLYEKYFHEESGFMQSPCAAIKNYHWVFEELSV